MKVEDYRAMLDMAEDEHHLQRRVTQWLEHHLPADLVWTAVDHAAKLSPRQAGARKERGVKRGQADYRFVLPPHGRSAEIELKRPKGGRQSKDQREWEAAVIASGGLYLVCQSIAEVQGALAAWGVQVRA